MQHNSRVQHKSSKYGSMHISSVFNTLLLKLHVSCKRLFVCFLVNSVWPFLMTYLMSSTLSHDNFLTMWLLSYQYSTQTIMIFLYAAAENQAIMISPATENLSWNSWIRLKTEHSCKTISMTTLLCSVTKHNYVFSNTHRRMKACLRQKT